MPMPIVRQVLVRRPVGSSSPLSAFGRRAATRRFESTTTTKATEAAQGAASKATSTAAQYTAKAQQGLSRVTSAAGPAIINAARGVTGALGRVGGRTGRFIAFVERQVPFVVYYSRVGLELSKLVFQAQKMSPPSLATFQSYFNTALRSVRNPSSLIQATQKVAGQPAALLQQVRGLSRVQLAAGGVLLAECLGFFTAGEMLGRFKLVGYHGSAGGHH